MADVEPETDDVTLRSQTGAQLRLSDPQRPCNDAIVDYLVDFRAPGAQLQAAVTSYEGDGLPAFLEQLAHGYRGWEGIRSWRSLQGDLQVDATWNAGGHVDLTVSLRPGEHEPGWELISVFSVEAGAEMERLAATVFHFFTGGSGEQPPSSESTPSL